MIVYCNNCRREIGEDNKFCPYCGKMVDNIYFGKISEDNFELDEDRTDKTDYYLPLSDETEYTIETTENKKKSKLLFNKISKKHIIIITLCVLISGIILFFIFNDVSFEIKDKTPKPAPKPQSESEIINYYKICINEFRNNENGSFTKNSWQNMNDAGFVDIPVVNDIIAYMFEKNFISEKQAEAVTYSIGSDEGKSECVTYNTDDDSIITSAYAEEINGNYLLTLNFREVVDPEYQSSFLTDITGDIYYRSDIVKMIEAFPQLKEPGNTEVKYQKFTIICEVTPYKELVNIKHIAEIKINIEKAKIYLLPVEQITIDLNTKTEYLDFIYSR